MPELCYNPLTMIERMKRVKKIVNEVCKDCEKEMKAGYKDPCWDCIWQWLMNHILGNDNNES